jgi:hypothetical protein
MFDAYHFRERMFTKDEIEALLSRDVERVLEQFATEQSVVVGDRVYSPFWLYINTPEDIKAAGITAEMIEEKLPLYAEFNFTEEATLAFEEKLSEFVGREVVLMNERAVVGEVGE